MAKTASRYVNLVIYFITSYFISASGVLAQASRPENPPVSQAVYQEAKTLFAKFEKEHGEFILTKNTRMHYLSWGDSKSVPFIWCHGSLTNSYEFAGIADSLVKAGYWVIAIDYYGHGQTPIPNHPVSLYHIADDIRELMNQLNIKKAVIGGWSRGGAVATAFYDAYPESVLGIILEDGGSVSINTGYHRMEQKMLDSTFNKIVSSFVAETTYKTEFDAYSAIYDPEHKGSQFENLAWIMKTQDGTYAICPGVLELFNMKTEKQWSDNILRPTQSPLFAQSFSILEPKIIYRNLKVPMLILDPVSSDDIMDFEEDNRTLRIYTPT